MLGIDVGGTKVLGIVLSPEGEVLAEERRDTASCGSKLVDDLAVLAADLLASGHCARSGPSERPTLGVGLPGLVDRAGVLRFAPNLPGASGTALSALLGEKLDGAVSIEVDNDATCAAAGECAFGAGRGRRDVLFVTLGTGIGGGILADGAILHGSGNFAGEIGHMVVDPQGPPCGCGRRGCWERYASGSGLGRIARDAALAGRAGRIMELAGGEADSVRGEHVVQAAAAGDEEALAILAEFGWWLALGLANLANVLDPEMIVVGGGLGQAGELLLEPARRAFREQLEGFEVRPAIELAAATLGDRGGAIGAAVLGSARRGARATSAAGSTGPEQIR